MPVSIFDFGLDLWIELVISNDLSGDDIFSLGLTCKYLSGLLKKEKILQFLEDKKIHFGICEGEKNQLPMWSVAWSHDTRGLASGDGDGKIYIWNVKTGTIKKMLESEDRVECLVFHPQKAALLASGHKDGSLCLWDTEKSEIKAVLAAPNHTEGISCLAFHPDGQYLASGGSRKAVRIWNVGSGECEHELGDPKSVVDCIAFTSDGKYLAASTLDAKLFVWNFATLRLVKKIILPSSSSSSSPSSCPSSSKISFQFFKDNKTLVLTNSNNSHVSFYDVASGKEITEMRIEAKKKNHFKIALHPNQKTIALGGQNGLEIWDIPSKKLLEERAGFVNDLSFSPDARALVVPFFGGPFIFDMGYICSKSSPWLFHLTFWFLSFFCDSLSFFFQ